MSATADFEAFYAAAYPGLVGQVFVMLGDLDEAQDVVQEAFGRAGVRWSSVRHELPEVWVRQAAFTLAAKRLRRRARPGLRERLATRRKARGVPPAIQPGLHLAVARLPALYRAVLALHHIAELPTDEIGKLLRIPSDAVVVHLDNARRMLDRRLSPASGGSRR